MFYTARYTTTPPLTGNTNQVVFRPNQVLIRIGKSTYNNLCSFAAQMLRQPKKTPQIGTSPTWGVYLQMCDFTGIPIKKN
jgi:hypothetical protein